MTQQPAATTVCCPGQPPPSNGQRRRHVVLIVDDAKHAESHASRKVLVVSDSRSTVVVDGWLDFGEVVGVVLSERSPDGDGPARRRMRACTSGRGFGRTGGVEGVPGASV